MISFKLTPVEGSMSLGAKRNDDLRLHGLTDLLQAISAEFPSASALKFIFHLKEEKEKKTIND